jgi:hypothetical protein
MIVSDPRRRNCEPLRTSAILNKDGLDPECIGSGTVSEAYLRGVSEESTIRM